MIMAKPGLDTAAYRVLREWMKANLPWVCHRCGSAISREITAKNSRHRLAWSADHYPLARVDGGLTTLDNLRPAHNACNSAAGNEVQAQRIEALANPRSRDWGV